MEAALRAYRDVRRQTTRDTLIMDHVPLVQHVLGRLLTTLPQGVDRENLLSAGICGLVEAATHFDESRGVAFSTYAFRRIRGAILDELRRNCPLPQHMLEKWSRLREAYAGLDGEATPESLGAAAGLREEEVHECLAAVQLTRPETWHAELSNQIPDRSGEAAEEELHRSEMIEQLTDEIQRLPEQMRIAVTLYYRNNLRLKEIGEVMGLSESRISRILTSAQLALRERLARKPG